jgi:orotidine-5'-phosphate decarboxylase
MTNISYQDRLIVALDYPDRSAALRLVEQLSGVVSTFKIGNQLFTAEGPALVREVIESGAKVFLDLKFHDIPNTVAGAITSAAGLGIAITNVHALGGLEMMRAAARAVAAGDGAAPGSGLASGQHSGRPAVIAVTVLTSMDQATLTSIGVDTKVDEQAVRLAALAKEAGLDGVVASPREVRIIRERVATDNFLIVTPGIRPEWAAAGDQRRIATPSEAIRNGADYLVVGRPITGDPDPKAAAQRLIDEIT